MKFEKEGVAKIEELESTKMKLQVLVIMVVVMMVVVVMVVVVCLYGCIIFTYGEIIMPDGGGGYRH